MHSPLLHVYVAVELGPRRIARCTMRNPSYTSSNRIINFCLTEPGTVQDFLLLTRRLAHGSCSWPTRWTMIKLCRVV